MLHSSGQRAQYCNKPLPGHHGIRQVVCTLAYKPTAQHIAHLYDCLSQVICILRKLCNIYRVHCKCHNHQRKAAGKFFLLKKTNRNNKKTQHQNQPCCSLTVFRKADLIAFTYSMYSRDFENPSEKWHFSGLSYPHLPQTY